MFTGGDQAVEVNKCFGENVDGQPGSMMLVRTRALKTCLLAVAMPSSGASALSTGSLVGIAIGSVAGVVALVVFATWLARRGRHVSYERIQDD